MRDTSHGPSAPAELLVEGVNKVQTVSRENYAVSKVKFPQISDNKAVVDSRLRHRRATHTEHFRCLSSIKIWSESRPLRRRLGIHMTCHMAIM